MKQFCCNAGIHFTAGGPGSSFYATSEYCSGSQLASAAWPVFCNNAEQSNSAKQLAAEPGIQYGVMTHCLPRLSRLGVAQAQRPLAKLNFLALIQVSLLSCCTRGSLGEPDINTADQLGLE